MNTPEIKIKIKYFSIIIITVTHAYNTFIKCSNKRKYYVLVNMA